MITNSLKQNTFTVWQFLWPRNPDIFLGGSLARLLEKAMAPLSSILAWKIPWTEEPGGLSSMGSHSRTRLKQLSSSSSSLQGYSQNVSLGLGSYLEASFCSLRLQGWSFYNTWPSPNEYYRKLLWPLYPNLTMEPWFPFCQSIRRHRLILQKWCQRTPAGSQDFHPHWLMMRLYPWDIGQGLWGAGFHTYSAVTRNSPYSTSPKESMEDN